MKQLALNLIRQDGNTQPRTSRRADWSDDYASDISEGRWDWKRPGAALTVFYDGAAYWLADGFHRRDAAEIAGLDKVPCDVRKGTQRDAQLFACGANAVHGHRRTNDDKRRAVAFMLADEEWSQWSDNEIARRCGVSQSFVTGLRAKAASNLKDKIADGDAPPPKRKRTSTRNGKTYAMDTSKIGKGKSTGDSKPKRERKPKPQPDEKSAPPPASTRGFIDPIDHCIMTVRRVVLDAMQEIAITDWAALVAALRDEINDIEKVAERRRADNGYHAAH